MVYILRPLAGKLALEALESCQLSLYMGMVLCGTFFNSKVWLNGFNLV